MEYQTYYVSKNLYSIELKHKVCKEHIDEGIWLADLVHKYNLTNHSLVHDWLRQLGYIDGNYKFGNGFGRKQF
jgi:transposase-like protein